MSAGRRGTHGPGGAPEGATDGAGTAAKGVAESAASPQARPQERPMIRGAQVFLRPGDAGFSVEGILRHDYYRSGRFQDVYRMSLLRAEWEVLPRTKSWERDGA